MRKHATMSPSWSSESTDTIAASLTIFPAKTGDRDTYQVSRDADRSGRFGDRAAVDFHSVK
jgi:hypothetical protein